MLEDAAPCGMWAADMIEIAQLRYVRLGTPDLPAAVDFATRILGLQIVDQRDGQVRFRSDFRDHTLVYVSGDARDQAIGFEIHGDAAFAQALAELDAAGLRVTIGTAAEAERRAVRSFASVTTPGGTRIELALRPLHSGWRFFPSRDTGITGLEAVAVRSTDAGADEAFWTHRMNGHVSDWVGDAAYLRFDDAHHRLAIHPAATNGILAVEYRVESVDQLMQSLYFLQAAQVRIVHGPGRRPTSEQMFLTFAGPDGMLFSFVTEGRAATATPPVPRQFARSAASFCGWGSESSVPEFQALEERFR